VSVKPLLQALWMVDDATQDTSTGKVDVTGIFDEIDILRPATHFTAQAFLFFTLTGLHGEVDLTLQYVDLSDLSLLLDRPFSVRANGPLESQVVCSRVPAMPVPHPGIYAWELHWQNELVGSSRITARVS
jgi:hypothetical protein